MRKARLSVFGLGLLFLTAGCGQAPSEQLTAAQQAIDRARGQEAETYANAEYQEALDALSSAQAEIAAQDSAWFFSRDYTLAAELLTQAEQAAEKAGNAAESNKEQARIEAEAALIQAEEALAAANTALQSAPRGKGTQADLQALRADLDAAMSALAEARASFQASRYSEANTQLTAVISKAQSISTEVGQALGKTRRARQG